MRISDWSSDVCSSDLGRPFLFHRCSEGSESEADACDERVEVTEIVDELVTIFALGIDVLGQLVLVAGTDVRIVDVAKGVAAGGIELAVGTDLGDNAAAGRELDVRALDEQLAPPHFDVGRA